MEVTLIETWGSDESIVEAAGQSPGGVKKSETRDLIRTLMRMRHTVPFEFAGAVFELKMPIFTMRQHVRHRTAAMVEKSARYSEALPEFYVPDDDHIRGDIGCIPTVAIRDTFHEAYESCQMSYEFLLECGLPKELARAVLPVGNETQCRWTMNLHNLLHYFKLRRDTHAQREIQDLANAMYELIKPIFPLTCEAWEDYVFNAKNFSRMEQKMLQDVIRGEFIGDANYYGVSEKELAAFVKWLDTMVFSKSH